MKINKFEVESEIDVTPEGIVSGWFKMPAAPHQKCTFEIDLEGVVSIPQEIEACDTCGRNEDDWPACNIEGDCPHVDVRAEQVLLPDGKVAEVKPLATSDPEGDQQARTDADAEKGEHELGSQAHQDSVQDSAAGDDNPDA